MLDGSVNGEIASTSKEKKNLTSGEINPTNATTSAVAEEKYLNQF